MELTQNIRIMVVVVNVALRQTLNTIKSAGLYEQESCETVLLQKILNMAVLALI